MKSGAWMVFPVSRVMVFITFVVESPLTPSGASVTVSTTLAGSSITAGAPSMNVIPTRQFSTM